MTGAAILAGGRARRLGGVLKPTLVVGGRRIIDRQLAVLRPLFDIVVIVSHDAPAFLDMDLDIDVIGDREPGRGPLAGIDAALSFFAARAPEASVVCVAGDMPLLSSAVLTHLRDAPPALAVVPRLARGPEPLCARYAPSFATAVSAALACGDLAVHALIARHPVTFVDEAVLRALDPELRTFLNVNTPEELAAARALATWRQDSV
ncbi:MAG TPA: molybdenum cofactor guanylyltransferase [Polyangia bacterium]